MSNTEINTDIDTAIDGSATDAVRERERLLPAAGFSCAVLALVATLTGWHVRVGNYGVGDDRPHAAYVVLVAGGACALLLAAVWWRPDVRVPAGFAAAFALVAAIAGLVGVRTADEPVVTGAGPWLAMFGFAAAGVLAVLAAAHEPRREPIPDVGDAEATRTADRVRTALTDHDRG